MEKLADMTLLVVSTDSPASNSSFLPTDWSEHMLRKRYTDPMKLKESLDEVYGQGKYQVIVRSRHIVIKYHGKFRTNSYEGEKWQGSQFLGSMEAVC